MPELISLRAYARSRKERGLPGGSLPAVQKAIQTKRITAGEGGIDPEAADEAWARNTEQGRATRGQDARGPVVPTASDEPPSYSDARARRETAAAGLAELE